jgi:hypothetical protein
MHDPIKIPKAYLPASSFNESETRYVDLIADLIAIQANFTYRTYRWTHDEFKFNCEARISHFYHQARQVEFKIAQAKGLRRLENTEGLVNLNWKKDNPKSVFWTRLMIAPVPSAAANHLLSGIRLLSGFESNSGFKIAAEDSSAQKHVDAVMAKHNVWGMRTTGDLWFLNT